MAPKKTAAQEERAEAEKPTLLSRALTSGSAKDMERDELLDIVYWFRSFLGLVVGLTAGLLKLTGAPVIMMFAALIFGLTFWYLTKFLEIEEGEFNEQELNMEGLSNGVGLFLLTWILVYSYV